MPIEALESDIFVILLNILLLFFVNRIEIKYDHENITEEKNEPKICSSSFNKHHHHIASCTDLSLTSTAIVEKRQKKNRSIDSGLNDAANDSSTKRNSVSEIVAL